MEQPIRQVGGRHVRQRLPQALRWHCDRCHDNLPQSNADRNQARAFATRGSLMVLVTPSSSSRSGRELPQSEDRERGCALYQSSPRGESLSRNEPIITTSSLAQSIKDRSIHELHEFALLAAGILVFM